MGENYRKLYTVALQWGNNSWINYFFLLHSLSSMSAIKMYLNDELIHHSVKLLYTSWLMYFLKDFEVVLYLQWICWLRYANIEGNYYWHKREISICKCKFFFHLSSESRTPSISADLKLHDAILRITDIYHCRQKYDWFFYWTKLSWEFIQIW